MRGHWILFLTVGLFASAVCADEALDRQLIDAVSERNTARASELLDKGASTEAQGYYKTTPLITAASTGDLAMIELLLGKGARVEAENGLGQTALTAGVAFRGVVEQLLKAGADINRPNKEGETPLMAAAEETGMEMVRLLLARGADPRARSKEGDGVLGKALGNRDKKMIGTLFRELLAAGAPVDTRSAGRPLFTYSVMRGREDVARELLRHGADPWARSDDGTSALDTAVQGVGVDDGIMRLLLSLNPSKETLNQALRTSADNDNLKAFLWLEQAGADLSTVERDETLLGVAVNARAWAVSRELLRRGFSPNAPASKGRKPLELAFHRGDVEMVRLLLRSGADPNKTGEDDEPLIRAAILTENPEILELMIVAGARKDVSLSGTPLKKIVRHWTDPKLVAAFKKAPTAQARAQLGLVKPDDDALFKAIVGTWKDKHEIFTTTFRHDGTYTTTYDIVGGTRTDAGFWSVNHGDLVLDERASRDLAPAITTRPIVRMTEETMLLILAVERTVWTRVGRPR